MAGAAEPPEGIPPEGAGSEDEYRSVVFDESFVNAARLQEFSAHERIRDHAPAVRRRAGRGLNRQLIVMVVLIALAFGTAVFMGVRTGEVTAASPAARRTEPLRMTVIPLVPQAAVPGARKAADLYAHSPAASFTAGAAGITLPAPKATEHYTQGQVLEALTTAKDYLVQSSLNPRVLTGGSVRSVRLLVDPRQLDQFDHSVERPRADGRHAATGWLTRFDPDRVALADPRSPARVRGSVSYQERGGMLEVSSEHTFAYAVRAASQTAEDTGSGAEGAEATGEEAEATGEEAEATGEEAKATGAGSRATGAGSRATGKGDEATGQGGEVAGGGAGGRASLLTVRRELHFRFDPTDLRSHRTELLISSLQAGPLDCAADSADRLQPLLAGARASGSGPSEGTDPYAPEGSTSLCGTLSVNAQPSLPARH